MLSQELFRRFYGDFQQLQCEALVADNPLMDFDQLLFVKRYTYQSSHYYTDFIDGTENPGGNLSILSLKDGTVTEILPSMKQGIFGRYDLSFDGKRVVFDWKRAVGEGFRIYETGLDGKGLRQLTSPPPDEPERIKKYDNSYSGGTSRVYQHHTDDMHPCYLPDGGIVFTSSRCEYGTLCDGPDKLTTAVLYRMDGDGQNMEKLTDSAVSEFAPSVMNDGRILYSRWEYVDKGQLGVKCIWAMRPDGSGTVAANSSGNSRDGVVDADWITGNLGGALDFDTASAEEVVVTDFDIGTDFTLAFWFKVDDNTGNYFQYMFNWAL